MTKASTIFITIAFVLGMLAYANNSCALTGEQMIRYEKKILEDEIDKCKRMRNTSKSRQQKEFYKTKTERTEDKLDELRDDPDLYFYKKSQEKGYIIIK